MEQIICSEKQVRLEKQHLERVFHANGYPKHVIRKGLYKRRMAQLQQDEQKQTQQEDIPQEKPKMIVLPYLKRVSEHIQHVCKRVGIKAVFKSHGTLRELLTKVKNPQLDCDESYIGETGRNLQKRLKEQQ